jgi:hypothetical protein
MLSISASSAASSFSEKWVKPTMSENSTVITRDSPRRL